MKIIGIGRNYAAHIEELNNERPGEPVVFLKPDTALLKNNEDFYYPDYSEDVHHEVELVFRISREGKYINERFAKTYVDGIGLGIDFTARDLQSKAKEKGLPWTLAKGFNHSAPVSGMHDPAEYPDWADIDFRLEVNGEVRQEGNSALMLWKVPYLIAFISRYITLKKGDLIYSGTPKGVGPVQRGDHLRGFIGDTLMLDFHVK